MHRKLIAIERCRSRSADAVESRAGAGEASKSEAMLRCEHAMQARLQVQVLQRSTSRTWQRNCEKQPNAATRRREEAKHLAAF